MDKLVEQKKKYSVTKGFLIPNIDQRGYSNGLAFNGDFQAAANYVTPIDNNIAKYGAIYIDDVIAGGKYRFADGSVTEPSISFNLDTNTGRYRLGADQVGESADGSLWYMWDTTKFIIGGATTLRHASSIFEVVKNQNAATGTAVSNSTDGTLSHAYVGAIGSSGRMAMVGATAATFTSTIGSTGLKANEAYLTIGFTGGALSTNLAIVNPTSNAITFRTGAQERGRVGSSGEVEFGSGTVPSAPQVGDFFFGDSGSHGTHFDKSAGTLYLYDSTGAEQIRLSTAASANKMIAINPAINNGQFSFGTNAQNMFAYDSTNGTFLTSVASFAVQIDSNNDSSTAYFGIYKDATAHSGGSVLFKIVENGAATLTQYTHASYVIDRSNTAWYSGLRCDDSSVEKWFVGQKGSSSNLSFRYNGASDFLIVGTDGETTIDQWLQVGTATDASAQGAAVFGLTGAARWWYDRGNQKVVQYNSSNAIVITEKAVAISGNDSLDNHLNITATLPTTMTAQTNGVLFDFTSAGSSAFQVNAMQGILRAGYTGSNGTWALWGPNLTAGTGTNPFTELAINGGCGGVAVATTTGTNVGAWGLAKNGNRSIGTWGQATVDKASATNIGVAGFGLNGGASGVQIGGYFGLASSAPTFASAALMCDNGSQTSDIFIARDNGTTKFSIIDGPKIGVNTGAPGNIFHVATSDVRMDLTVTAVGGAGAPALGASGNAGTPTTAAQNSWATIILNGTTYYIPIWV